MRHGNEKQGLSWGVGLDSKDPLGLCDLSDAVRQRGVVLVQVLGGMSLLGALGLAVVRVAGWEMPEGGVWGWLVGDVK